MVIGNELPAQKGRWTWECGDKKSVIDYTLLFPQEHRHELVEMVVEDRRGVDTGLDHNVILDVFKVGSLKR